jgi:hemerythrin
VLAFLKLWLTRHIQGTDRKYAEWFKQQGIALAAPNGDTP